MRMLLVALVLMTVATVALPAAAQDPQPQPTPAAAEAPPPEAAPQAQLQEAPAAAPVTVPVTYFEKLKVVVDGKADVSGVVQLKFQPSGGEAKLVNVNVLARMKAKEIARDIWKELSLAAGDSFKVKLDGKEIDVKKSGKKGPNFALVVLAQSAAGVSVSTKR